MVSTDRRISPTTKLMRYPPRTNGMTTCARIVLQGAASARTQAFAYNARKTSPWLHSTTATLLTKLA